MRGSWYKNHPVCGQQMLSFLRLFCLIVIKNSMCQISKWFILLLGPVLQSLFKNGMFQNGGSCKFRILDALFCNNHTIYCDAIYCDVICISTTVTSYVSLQRLRYEVCNSIRGNEITCFRFWCIGLSRSVMCLFLSFEFISYHLK